MTNLRKPLAGQLMNEGDRWLLLCRFRHRRPSIRIADGDRSLSYHLTRPVGANQFITKLRVRAITKRWCTRSLTRTQIRFAFSLRCERPVSLAFGAR